MLRYIEGECSLEEAAAVQAWLAADPQRVELLDELRAVWRHTGQTTQPWNLARARDRLVRARGLASQAAAGESAARPQSGLPVVNPRVDAGRGWWAGWPAWRIVAGVTITLVASATYVVTRTSVRAYETAAGQRMELSLPDGSRVLLGTASRLRVPRRYGVSDRHLELQGEAYFIVQHDAARPFLVRTRLGVAQDLGTEFGVREYPQDTIVQVVVASGGVALRGRSGTAAGQILSANDRGVVGTDGRVTIVHGVLLEHHLAWTQGRLVFDQVRLADIMRDLERWYDLDIETPDRSLEDERITISFSHQTADQAISELATVLDARHARNQRRVQLFRVQPPQ